jgi:cell wall-associated NlpC family hydrolase
MPRRTVSFIAALACVLTLVSASPAAAALPSWLKPAVDYLVDNGSLQRKHFKPNARMKRATFKRIMEKNFGGGYKKTEGWVSTREVDAALVRVLGYGDLARKLNRMTTPGGWDPKVPAYFGTEIVARELGLRYNHEIGSEHLENSVHEKMKQANVVYAIYRAKVAPSTWGAEELEGFRLANLTGPQRAVVRFAFQQVGVPYYWSGEWPTVTPLGYPYGAQVHGGFDCSGFAWYVTRRKESIWNPQRPYSGWRLDQRSSADIGGGAKRRLRFSELKPGDLVVFGSEGRKTTPAALYHTGVYIGRGWMIDSSGSQAGVSLSRIAPGSWWNEEFAWGRRVIR